MSRSESPLIIRRPELQSRTQRTLGSMLRLGAWAFWAYLWVPLLTVGLWSIGLREVWIQVLHGARGANLQLLPWLVTGVACMIVIWSSYNRYAFTGKERRQAARPLSSEKKAAGLGVTDSYSLWQLSQQRISLSFDAAGEIRWIGANYEEEKTSASAGIRSLGEYEDLYESSAADD